MSTQSTPARRAELTTEQLESYEHDGFLVIENLISPEELAALHQRQYEYTHGGRDTSALTIQLEPRIQRGELKVEHPGDGIRKIDGLLESDDLFHRLGTHPSIVGVLKQILGPDIKLYRNTLLFKPPRVGSAKGMHQDSPYWPSSRWNCVRAGSRWMPPRLRTAAWGLYPAGTCEGRYHTNPSPMIT